MIARDIILFLLLNILPFIYLDWRYLHKKSSWGKRLLCWLPCVAMTAYTVYLAIQPNFIPDNDRIFILYGYLFLIGFIIAPIWIYCLCSIGGRGCSSLVRRFKGKNESEDIPAAFDGYRIVLFSDAHVGSYMKHNEWVLQRAIDSINAQQPDMIIFTGDLQNIQPKDIYPHMDVLSSLKAGDGVYSVLGNHDYAEYMDYDEAMKVANTRETISLERQLGWNLLLNEHCKIERDNSHFIVAGMENDGDGKRFPQKGDLKKTLDGVEDKDFILMLEHDPSAWRRKIIPDGRAQLTLSGHTHKMQFSLFGWCPMSLSGKEFNGWYREGRQSLFVTAGVGGLIPFRFGATGEIVVLTLKKAKD